MDIIQFMKQSILYPRTVGAIVPSSHFSAKKMIEPIDFEHVLTIVELGAGTGVFTKELVKKKGKETKLIVFEINKEFANKLKEKYKQDASIIIINDSAEKLVQYGLKNIEYIISGLPFATLERQISKQILNNVSSVLKEEGKFITIQYTRKQFKFISSFFNAFQTKRACVNIPPAYILICQK